VPGPVQVFAIMPAHQVQDFLDFANCNKYQTWMYGIKPLEQDEKLDCCEANLKKFLDAYMSKEEQMGGMKSSPFPFMEYQNMCPQNGAHSLYNRCMMRWQACIRLRLEPIKTC